MTISLFLIPFSHPFSCFFFFNGKAKLCVIASPIDKCFRLFLWFFFFAFPLIWLQKKWWKTLVFVVFFFPPHIIIVFRFRFFFPLEFCLFSPNVKQTQTSISLAHTQTDTKHAKHTNKHNTLQHAPTTHSNNTTTTNTTNKHNKTNTTKQTQQTPNKPDNETQTCTCDAHHST